MRKEQFEEGQEVQVKVNKEMVTAIYHGWNDTYDLAEVIYKGKKLYRKIYEGRRIGAGVVSPIEMKTSRFDVNKRFDFIRDIVNMVITGESKSVIISGSGGLGKCHRRGERILMFDLSVKKVEDIQVGDFLMGDDSTPREVLSLARGRDQMYEVHPNKGDIFCINGPHILCLVDVRTGRVHELSLNDYLADPTNIRKTGSQADKSVFFELYHVPVDFESRPVSIDPYWLGLWLGDGSSHTAGLSINREDDPEIIDYHTTYVESLGLRTSISKPDTRYNDKVRVFTPVCHESKKGCNVLLNRLREYNLSGPIGTENRKRVPPEYLLNDRQTRIQVLAGLIDADGGLYHSKLEGGSGCYGISIKDPNLADDVVKLARSLGYLVSIRSAKKTIKSTGFVGYYPTLTISGANDLPCKLLRKQCTKPRRQRKNCLRTGFSVLPIGEDDYFGFTLTGNGRFLMHDFLVTHNTYTVMECLTAAQLTDVDEFEENEDAEELGLGNERVGDYTVVKGFTTPKALYRLLWNNKDRIVVFDDCDSVWDNPTCVSILKCALDSYETRRIHWLSEIRDEDDLPQNFEFTGKIIFVSNLSLGDLDQAVLSRCLYVDVTMTSAEKIERIRGIMPNIRPDMAEDIKADALTLLEDKKDEIGDLNIRTFLKVLEIRHANSVVQGADTVAQTNWRELAEYVITAF